VEKKTRAALRAATAERILGVARQEFADKGFTAATTRSIAERAGVDASLVLQHFGSKANLFAAAVKLSGNSVVHDRRFGGRLS
jgi:AcrR family transcriptional regulator